MQSYRIYYFFSTFFVVFTSISSQKDPGMILNLICQAKCLETFKIMTSANENYEGKRQPFLIESFCLKDHQCKGCISACSTQDIPVNQCKSDCRGLQSRSSQTSCIQSCEFIEANKINRPGICPSKAAQFKCSQTCQKDSDCFKQGTKCCKSLLCGSSCQIAKPPSDNVPPVPSAPIVRQTIDKKDRDQINFDLDWSTYDIHSVDYPVLFLVQVRVGQSLKDKNTVQGIWRDLISTTKSGVIISSIDPENLYQFRLLAFSKRGYKNNGEMTSPITVQYTPTYPLSPRNVTEKMSRIVGKHISVTLTWQPGESNSLVPLSNYKINWKRFHEMYESNPLLAEYSIVIPSTETSYTIQELAPATTYRIEITSVVVYKGLRYNSTATIYYVTTSALPNTNPSSLDPSFDNINEIEGCACGKLDRDLPIVIHNSTFVNGQLSLLVKLKDGVEFDKTFAPYSFRIQWYPTACIESSSSRLDSQISDLPQSFVVTNNINHYITGLRMQCSYKVDIELFSQLAKRKIKIWDGCFCTPSCFQTANGNEEMAALCPKTDQYIPPAPKNLRVSLKKTGINSQSNAELRWDCAPTIYVTAFRITWGPRIQEPIDEPMYSKKFLPLLDTEKAISKVVKYPHQLLLLKNLEVDQIYLVKVQSLNNRLSSQESVLFFKVYFEKNSYNPLRFPKPLLLLLMSLCLIASML